MTCNIIWLRLQLIALLLFHTFNFIQASTSQCPDNWLSFEENCYLVSEIYNASLNKATRFCENNGGRLLKVAYTDDEHKMFSLINLHNLTEKFWVGLNEEFLTYQHMGSMYYLHADDLRDSCEHDVDVLSNYSIVPNFHCYPGYSIVRDKYSKSVIHRSSNTSSVEECTELCRNSSDCKIFAFNQNETGDVSSRPTGICNGEISGDTKEFYVQKGSVTCMKVEDNSDADYLYLYSSNCKKTRSIICEYISKRTTVKPQTDVTKTSHLETTDTVTNFNWSELACPEGFFQIKPDRKCYKIVTVEKWSDGFKFHEAQQKCRSEPGSNPDLVSIHSVYENAALTSRFLEYTWGMWIGLKSESNYYAYSSPNLIWRDGSKPGYENWAEWSKGNYAGCAEIVTSPGTSGSWNLLNCYSKKGYICQTFKGLHSQIDIKSENSSCKTGWLPYRNACFKVFETSQSFQSAVETCRAQNSSLASVHNESENAFVLAMSEKFLPVWIGLKKSNIKWSDGWSVTYTKWSPRYTSKWDDKCVQMLDNGMWSYSECMLSKPFVCKYTADEAITFPHSSPGVCPNSKWTKWGDSCYFFWAASYNKTSNFQRISSSQTRHPYKFNWKDAQRRCKLLGSESYDSNLVVIDNYLEDWMIVKKLKNIMQKFDSNTRVWIGVERNRSSDFRTVRDSELGYRYWAPGEPNGHDQRQQCGEMLLDVWTGAWNDHSCDTKNYFICETKVKALSKHKPTVIQQTFKCPSSSWIQIGNYCYLLKTNIRVTWKTASEMCKLYGKNKATLTSIHSSEEKTSLVNELMLLQDDITGSRVWIGLCKEGPFKEYPYRWQDNSTLVYQFWFDSEPSDRSGTYNCVDMYSVTGEWADVSCQESRGFICKIEVDKEAVMNSTSDIIKEEAHRISGVFQYVIIIGISTVIVFGFIIIAICCWNLGRKNRHKFSDYVGMGLVLSAIKPDKNK